jgi:Flp pilus assembly protein TadG
MLRLFGTPRVFGAATHSRLGDHGAVAFEFALIFPVLLLMFAGIFGIGVVMIEDMQLAFVAQQAANVEAANLGRGLGAQWATGQLGQQGASFTYVDQASCPAPTKGAQVTGMWPISLGIFPSLTLQQTATACLP